MRSILFSKELLDIAIKFSGNKSNKRIFTLAFIKNIFRINGRRIIKKGLVPIKIDSYF